MPGKPDKTSHFSAYLGDLGGEKFMIRVLFVCHGRTSMTTRNPRNNGANWGIIRCHHALRLPGDYFFPSL